MIQVLPSNGTFTPSNDPGPGTCTCACVSPQCQDNPCYMEGYAEGCADNTMGNSPE